MTFTKKVADEIVRTRFVDFMDELQNSTEWKDFISACVDDAFDAMYPDRMPTLKEGEKLQKILDQAVNRLVNRIERATHDVHRHRRG